MMKHPRSTEPKDWALFYALELGWRVFPCHAITAAGACTCGRPPGSASGECDAPGKHPRIKGFQDDAALDAAQIETWWRRWPDASVALLTGDQFWVLDIDGPEGEDYLEDIQMRFGRLPDTPIAQTGRGGRHFLFAPVEGREIRNKIGLRNGVDVRGTNGFIVAAPSVHLTGRRYEWETESEPWTVTLAAAPSWLIEFVTGVGLAAPAPAPVSSGTSNRSQVVGKFDLAGALAGADQGGRDDAIFRLAAWCRAEGHSLESATEMVSICAANCRPPFDLEAARKKVEWVWIKYKEGWSEAAKAGSSGWAPDHTPDFREGRESNQATADEARAEDQTESRPFVEVTSEPKPKRVYEQTELGNAWRLRDKAENRLRYCHAFGCWLNWDGTRWLKDETGGAPAQNVALEVLRDLRQEAVDLFGDASKKAFKFAMDAQSNGQINAVLSIAKKLDGIPVTTEDLDVDPYMLNTPGGVVDLRSGLMHPHNSNRLITKITPVAPSNEGGVDLWRQFVHKIVDARPDLYTFIKKAAGYSLTGSTDEQCLFFAYGSGKNGKSTLIEMLQFLMGDYATSTSAETLMASKATSSSAEYDLARLKGMRLVAAQETGQGRRFAEDKIKWVTGRDTITARFPYGHPFTYKPTFKLWMSSNHKPQIRGTDEGIWRRIRLLPFEVRIAADEDDKNLAEKLMTHEAPRILSWLIGGCRQWFDSGLASPAAVADATEEYREEMDLFAVYLNECIESTGELDGFLETTNLYRSYSLWAERSGERPISMVRFVLELKSRGYRADKSSINRRSGFRGMRIIGEGLPV